MSEAAHSHESHLRLGDWLLGLLIALLAFSFPQKPMLELDSSWRQALAYFLHRGYPFGESVVFTYGPLGFLLGNTYTGLYFWTHILWQTTFSLVAAGLVVQVGRSLTGLSKFGYFAFFILWGVSYGDALHMMVIAFSGWIMIERWTRGQPAYPLLFGLWLALLSLIKFTNLMFAGFVVLMVVSFGWLKGHRRGARFLLGSFAGGFLVLWMLCGQSVLQLPAYVLNSLSISSGYQAVMGLPTPEGQVGKALWVFGSLGGYALWHFRSQPDRWRSSAVLLILAAFLFLNWKHGFVRADGHMLGFFYCGLVIAVAFPALLGETVKRWWVPRLILTVTIVACLAGMRGTFTSNTDYILSITNEKLERNVRSFLSWSTMRAQLRGQVDHWQREAELPKAKALIGEASVDVLGFKQAIALFNEFNYTPRPVFQGYSVYNSHLAALNARFITSEAAPEFLLVKLETIDERPLLNDDSHLMALFPHLYEFRLWEKDFLVFRKRPQWPELNSLQPRLVRAMGVDVEESVSLAEFGSDHLWITIDLPFNLAGKLRNFLYKPPFVRLRVTDHDGEEVLYRISRPLATAGFQINPLVTDFNSYLEAHGGEAARQVRSIKIEVAEADRRWLADSALVSLSALQPTNLKLEYTKQLERQRFTGFFALPSDFEAGAELSNVEVSGREAVVLHAPSWMTFPFRAGTSRITGAHGYPSGAYSDGGETDGAIFTVTWTDGEQTREIYRRNLDPVNRPDDRGLIDFSLDTTDLPPEGEIRFEIAVKEHPGWDWTAWADITIE